MAAVEAVDSVSPMLDYLRDDVVPQATMLQQETVALQAQLVALSGLIDAAASDNASDASSQRTEPQASPQREPQKARGRKGKGRPERVSSRKIR